MLEYKTYLNKISDSLYILVPSIIWRDSIFQKYFPKIESIEGSRKVKVSLKFEELPNKKWRILIEPL